MLVTKEQKKEEYKSYIMKFDQLFMVDGRESKEKKCFNVRKGKHKVFSFAGSLESENPFHENWREFLQEFPFLIKNLRSSVEKKFLMEEKFVKWILIAVFVQFLPCKAFFWRIHYNHVETICFYKINLSLFNVFTR